MLTAKCCTLLLFILCPKDVCLSHVIGTTRTTIIITIFMFVLLSVCFRLCFFVLPNFVCPHTHRNRRRHCCCLLPLCSTFFRWRHVYSRIYKSASLRCAPFHGVLLVTILTPPHANISLFAHLPHLPHSQQ